MIKTSDAVSEEHLDLAMRAFLDFERNRKPGHVKTPEYLKYVGLPSDIDPKRVVSVLVSMGYLKMEQEGEDISVRVSERGWSYFENRAKQDSEKAEFHKIADAAQKQAGAAVREAQSAKETARATKQIAEAANQTANQADIKGWLAVFISAAALLIELSVNLDSIMELLRALFVPH